MPTGLSAVSCRLVTRVTLRQLLPRAPLSNSLTGVPFLTSGHPRSRVQNPMSGFAPKQTKESSAWWTSYIVLQSKRNGYVKWINKMKKEFKGVEESPEVYTALRSLSATLKKEQNWKTPNLNGIYGFWLKKITSINKQSKSIEEVSIIEWMTQVKTTLIQKDPQKDPSQPRRDR